MCQYAVPVSLSLTSKSFFRDPLLWMSFFENVTFCFATRDQWIAFEAFLARNAEHRLSPGRLITSIKDVTVPKSEMIAIELDQCTEELLPNLRHLSLKLFVTQDATDAMFFEDLPREYCCRYRASLCKECRNAEIQADHHDLEPAKFAAQDSNETWFRVCTSRSSNSTFSILSPRDFIRQDFFLNGKTNCSQISGDQGYAFNRHGIESKEKTQLKRRILNEGTVILHLSGMMKFTCHLCDERELWDEHAVRVVSSKIIHGA